jgi:uncharacterized protein (TIGR00251 family)
MPLKVKATTGGVIVSVYVRPSAKQDRIDTADGIEIYTREPPEGNRANIAVIKMLSKTLLIPRNQISIIRGTTSRVKEVYIVGLSSERFKSQLQNIDGAEFKV